jgi:hypothetical protein
VGESAAGGCASRGLDLSVEAARERPLALLRTVSGVVSPLEADGVGRRILPGFGGALLRDQQVQRELRDQPIFGSPHLQ